MSLLQFQSRHLKEQKNLIHQLQNLSLKLDKVSASYSVASCNLQPCLND